MLTQEVATVRKTALYDEHVALGGKVVEFAGWAMPMFYEGIISEHRRVRSTAGLFDVSHMGEIFITGPGTFDFVQLVCTVPDDIACVYNFETSLSLRFLDGC